MLRISHALRGSCLSLPFLWVVLVLLLSTHSAFAVVDVRGFVAAGGTHADDVPVSWRDGGFGVLDLGDGSDEDAAARADLHLVVDAAWEPGERTRLGAVVHLLGREEPSSAGGEDVGLVEAYLEARWILRDADRLRLQLGHFFMPTSRENVDWAWSSPYTLSFSALNTWIGEEVRPTGLAAEYAAAVGALDELTFGASAFGGNDTAGVLLAWRGWAFSDRITVWDEVLPLPPVPSLGDGGIFHRQRDDGTLPFAEDLDDRVGWAAWTGWRRAESALLRAAVYDNRGDLLLHGDRPEDWEYAWRTRYLQLSGELQRGSWTFAGEWMSGSTEMGFGDPVPLDAEFEAVYLLASWISPAWLGGNWRISLRHDDFETVDTDSTPAALGDDNDGAGHAWTAALFWEWTRRPLRLGVEVLDVDATRDAATDAAGGNPAGRGVGGRQVRLELRYFFSTP